MSEPLKVKDRSQPYKITIFLLFSAMIVVVGYFLLGRGERPLGISVNQPSYITVTNASVTCPAATSTQIVDVQTGRTSFVAQISPSATNTITLCKSGLTTTCVTNEGGVILNATTTPRFEQTDAYTGIWSCISSNGSSTIGVSSSQ